MNRVSMDSTLPSKTALAWPNSSTTWSRTLKLSSTQVQAWDGLALSAPNRRTGTSARILIPDPFSKQVYPCSPGFRRVAELTPRRRRPTLLAHRWLRCPRCDRGSREGRAKRPRSRHCDRPASGKAQAPGDGGRAPTALEGGKGLTNPMPGFPRRLIPQRGREAREGHKSGNLPEPDRPPRFFRSARQVGMGRIGWPGFTLRERECGGSKKF